MNILLIYRAQIVSSKHHFYYFYTQLSSYLTRVGEVTKLYDCYLYPVEDPKLIDKDITYLELPEKKAFSTRENIDALLCFIEQHHIDCIFNLVLAEKDVRLFLNEIRCCFHVKLLHLCHNRPDLVVHNKKLVLSNSFSELKGIKQKVQKLLLPFYMYALKKYTQSLNRKYYKLHDAVIVLSDSYIDIYQKLIGEGKISNIYAIPNPLPPIFSQVPLEKKAKQIIFVGSLTKVKSVHRLLYIWSKIMQQLDDWSLVIVGDGPERECLHSAAKSLNLERVKFLGQQKAIPYIDQSSILCLVSNFEGLPTVFLEAMALSVVPIGYDTYPAIYDLIDSGHNGYIIPFEDTDLYAKTLVKLATDEPLRYELARNARLKSNEFLIDFVVA